MFASLNCPTAASSRRLRYLAIAGTLTIATGTVIAAASGSAPAAGSAPRAAGSPGSGLPVAAIEKIEQADGTVSGGVLSINIDREHLKERLHGVRLKPSFEIRHELYFQSLGSNRADFNGELAVLPGQQQRVIAAIQNNNLVFQAEHQHFTDVHPMIWFIHFRGTGNPLGLAARVHRVVQATSIHLPQSSPKHPKTPLPVHRLATILDGTAEKDSGGVVDVDLDRTNPERLGGHAIKPGLGDVTSVEFQPIGSHGRAIVVPDFGMTAKETQPVIRTMRRGGWTVECLYNQETGEHPQLYFSHMVKIGNAVSLARQVRLGLDHMAVSG